MAKLLVEARTAEWTSGDVVREVLVGVSVSRADDGTPVTGLGAGNFRVGRGVCLCFSWFGPFWVMGR